MLETSNPPLRQVESDRKDLEHSVGYGKPRYVRTVNRYRPGRGSDLAVEATCLYPGCPNRVRLSPVAGGRASLFCSSLCRANFANIRRQLLRAEARAEQDLARTDLGDAERARAQQLSDRARWHLLRFRSLASQEAHALPDRARLSAAADL